VLADGSRFEGLRRWCRRALARDHLVVVAHHLHTELGATVDELGALGVPLDVLAAFPAWKRGSRRGFRPEPLGFALPPAGAPEPITALRIQLSAVSWMAPLGLQLLRDLPRHMDATTRFVVVVEPGARLDRLSTLTQRLAPRAMRDGRIRFVELPTATVFAQDGARGARDRDGRAVLLVPRAFHEGGGRARDAIELSASVPLGLPIVRTRSYWEGGNIIHDENGCFVGADTIATNTARLGLTATEARALLSADLGADVMCLGDPGAAHYDLDTATLTTSGQDTFHIDLDVALLGRVGRRGPVALVADPSRGLELATHVLGLGRPFARQFLPPRQLRAHVAAEYEAEAHARFERLVAYSATLEHAGYRVIGVPNLRVGRTSDVFGLENLSFGYCNVLPGQWRGRPAVHYLPFGIDALDRAAEARFRAAGCEPVAVSRNPRLANELMRQNGGLRCACGSI
jgi:hypothetical protein